MGKNGKSNDCSKSGHVIVEITRPQKITVKSTATKGARC